jgi:iron complex outermembrane receptor protein
MKSRLSKAVLSLLALALTVLSPAVTWSQSLALSGKVVDPDGGVVSHARITITPAGAGRTYATVTGADGSFVMADVPDGRYAVQISAPGFIVATQDVTVDAQSRTLSISLQVAGLNEAVTVQGDASRPSVARTGAPLRDQPISVNTLSGAFMQTFAINDLVVALQNVPNVTAYNQYGVYEYYSFRGFSDSVQTVDGVRNEGNRVRTQLSNVDRVEVLKGPASVLYGAESIGATVNIVLKKPSAQPAYDASLAFGSWETARGTFGATGRLAGPSLLYRLDVGFDHAEGFRHDPSDKINVTPTVSWRASDRDQFEIRHSYNRNDLSGDGGIPVLTFPDGTTQIPDVPRARRYNTPQDYALSTDQNLRVGYTRILNANFGVRGTFSARKFDDDYWVAESLRVTLPSQVNRTFLYFKHERRPYFGQVELNGHVRFGVQHDLLAGWEHQNYRTRTSRSTAASAATTPIDLYDPVETHVTRTDFTVSAYDYTRIGVHAGYAQDTLTLASGLKAVFGLRVDDLRRRTNNNPITNGVEQEGARTTRNSSALTSREGIVYQPSQHLDLYAQHATAFRPNYNLQADGSTIDPETGRLFEFGQRVHLLNSRLDLNTALFHIEKKNIALARPGGLYDIAGKIRSKGFEAELEGRLASAWRLNLGYGYTQAEYVDYVTTSANFSGNVRPRTPRHTFSVSTSYAFANGFSVAVNARTQGDQFLNDANTLRFDGYALLNLNGTYTRGRMQYALTLSNLTDTEYWASTLGNTQLYPGEPLRVMATVRVRTR